MVSLRSGWSFCSEIAPGSHHAWQFLGIPRSDWPAPQFGVIQSRGAVAQDGG